MPGGAFRELAFEVTTYAVTWLLRRHMDKTHERDYNRQPKTRLTWLGVRILESDVDDGAIVDGTRLRREQLT
jgi:hypothetical protein